MGAAAGTFDSSASLWGFQAQLPAARAGDRHRRRPRARRACPAPPSTGPSQRTAWALSPVMGRGPPALCGSERKHLLSVLPPGTPAPNLYSSPFSPTSRSHTSFAKLTSSQAACCPESSWAPQHPWDQARAPRAGLRNCCGGDATPPRVPHPSRLPPASSPHQPGPAPSRSPGHQQQGDLRTAGLPLRLRCSTTWQPVVHVGAPSPGSIPSLAWRSAPAPQPPARGATLAAAARAAEAQGLAPPAPSLSRSLPLERRLQGAVLLLPRFTARGPGRASEGQHVDGLHPNISS